MASASPLLLVTGMLRSGTTLVEKLLASHPEMAILGQPFHQLYVDAKADFFRHLGLPVPHYPLGDLFREDRYRPEQLAEFLHRHRFAERMAATIRATAGAPEADVVGSKEVLVEEFLPHLLDHGFRAVLVLRDPRDVLASLRAAGAERHVGRPRPALLDLRNWRKSVHFARRLEGHPRFLMVRYEDLVQRPGHTLARLTDWLGVVPFPDDAATAPLRGQDGRPWRGNSSHGELAAVSSASVGRFATRLEPATVRFVEAVCGPEMAVLGYPAATDARDDPEAAVAAIREFDDPHRDTRPELADRWSDPARKTEEIERRGEPARERGAVR